MNVAITQQDTRSRQAAAVNAMHGCSADELFITTFCSSRGAGPSRWCRMGLAVAAMFPEKQQEVQCPPSQQIPTQKGLTQA